MLKKIIAIILVSGFFIQNTPALAQAEYSTLPSLDGKIDSFDNNTEKNNYSAPEPKIPTRQEIITSSITESPKGIATSAIPSAPVLDDNKPAIQNSTTAQTLGYVRYQKDLDDIINQLTDLKSSINEGVNIQLFSAKATTTKIVGEIFLGKYGSSIESNFETYRMVKDIIDTATFTRDYWIKSNKITYNQHGIPDQIIQTKFLKISTAVDRLVELSNMQNCLTEE